MGGVARRMLLHPCWMQFYEAFPGRMRLAVVLGAIVGAAPGQWLRGGGIPPL